MPPAAATAAGRRAASPARAPSARRVSGPVPPSEIREPARTRTRREVPARQEAPARREAPAYLEAPARREAPARHRETARRHRETARRRREAARTRSAAGHRTRTRELPRLDRIVRGRAWIPVLGAMLVAIVGLRVEVLKLGSSVGVETQKAAALESSIAVERSQVSELSDNQRIDKLAAAYGMVMPGPMDNHFVNASSASHVGATIRGIHAPTPSEFLGGLVAERQTDTDNAVAAAGTSTIGVLGGGATSASAGATSAATGATGAATGATSGTAGTTGAALAG